jgi:hypothetical protein
MYSENGENNDKVNVLGTGRRYLYLEILLMHDVIVDGRATWKEIYSTFSTL